MPSVHYEQVRHIYADLLRQQQQDLGGAVKADGGADLALDGTYLAAQGCVLEAEEEGTQLAGVIADVDAGAHLGTSGGDMRGGQSWPGDQQESMTDGARMDEGFADEAGGSITQARAGKRCWCSSLNQKRVGVGRIGHWGLARRLGRLGRGDMARWNRQVG